VGKGRRLCIALVGLIGIPAVAFLSGCRRTVRTSRRNQGRIVQRRGTSTLEPQTVDAADPRWRDFADNPCSTDFQQTFSYENTSTSYVRVAWDESQPTLSGTLSAVKLKPNFAYQMELKGRAGIGDVSRPPNPSDNPKGWASWQLGHVGRWWCETCDWNVSDAELDSHLKRGHVVAGYLMFDYFVTDKTGGAAKPFAVDSSFHVLWKVSQRTPGPNDSSPIAHTVVETSAWGYDADGTDGTEAIYAQWEPNRPLPGQVELPAGSYPVWFDVTEESFHANLNYRQPLGGRWAQVLRGDVQFTVTPSGLPPSGVGTITGTVTDAATGSPVRTTVVTLTDNLGGEPERTTQTKGNGTCALADVPRRAAPATRSRLPWARHPRPSRAFPSLTARRPSWICRSSSWQPGRALAAGLPVPHGKVAPKWMVRRVFRRTIS
jgi:hypothetical protein